MTDIEHYYNDDNFELLPKEPDQANRAAQQHRHTLVLRRNSFGSPKQRNLLADKLSSCKQEARCECAACIECGKAHQRAQTAKLMEVARRRELVSCTLVLDALAIPQGQLSATSFAMIKKQVREFFDKIGWSGFARGAIDLCLWVDGDNKLPTTWMPHVHFVTTRKSAEKLKALVAKSGPKSKRVRRPLMCKPVSSPETQLHYIFKFAVVKTVTFKGSTNAARPTKQKLSEKDLTEALLWFGKERAVDRFWSGASESAKKKGGKAAAPNKQNGAVRSSVSSGATLERPLARTPKPTPGHRGEQVSRRVVGPTASSASGEQGPLTAQKEFTLRVSAVIHHVDKDAYFLKLAATKIGGGRLQILVPRAASPVAIFEELCNRGANVPSSYAVAKPHIERALSEQPENVRKVTEQCGWHRTQFVTPQWHSGGTLKYFGSAPNELVPKGTLEGWRAGLKKACAASPYLEFAVGCAFAAPLLGVLGEQEGAFFYLAGDSSTGKSLALRVASSAVRRSRKSDLPTFDSTTTSFDELMHTNSDMLLSLDEVGRVNGDMAAILRDFAYRSTSGHGKRRSKVVAQSLPTRNWRLIGLASGEISLRTFTRAAGEELRLIEIAVPPANKGGIFAGITEQAARSTFARGVETAISTHYGVAFKAFVEHIVADSDSVVSEARKRIDSFLTKVGPKNSWEERLARKFAIVYAASVLAAKADIAPWPFGKCMHAVLNMYKNAMSIREKDSHLDKFISAVRKEMGGLPFIEANSRNAPQSSAVGFKRHDHEHGLIIMLDPQWVKQRIGNGRHSIDELKARGILVAGSDGKSTRQVALLNDRKRWICLRAPLI